jgi:hypothetical protein
VTAKIGEATPEEEQAFLRLCRRFIRDALSAARIVDAVEEELARETHPEDAADASGHLAQLFERSGGWLLRDPRFGPRLFSLSERAREPFLLSAPPGFPRHKRPQDVDDPALRIILETPAILGDDIDVRDESNLARDSIKKLLAVITSRKGVHRPSKPFSELSASRRRAVRRTGKPRGRPKKK